MANTNAGDIIDKAYKKVGIDDPSDAQDTNGLDALNNLLTSWSTEQLIIPFIIRANYALTAGDAEYTIGSGGDIAVVRPLKIEDAFLRDGNTDHPLTISPLKHYNEIEEKTTEGRPENLYYLPEYPLGKILFDLEPDKAYVLYYDSWKTITEFALTTTSIASILIPDEYKRALIFNLAIDLASDEDYELQRSVYVVANDSKDTIKALNASLRLPEAMKAERDITYILSR